MTAYEKLVSIRTQYPATTSSVHTLMLRAGELNRSRQFPNWIDINGVNLSVVSFENALKQVVYWASRETGKSSPRDVLSFVEDFVDDFAELCPGKAEAFGEIHDRQLRECEVPAMLREAARDDRSLYRPLV